MTTRTLLLIGAVGFAGSICFACLPNPSADSENSRSAFSVPTQIAFRYKSYDVREDPLSQFTCVGTRLADRWAITASHCLDGVEEIVAILCGDPSRESSVKMFRIHSKVAHNTHDASLMLFDRDLTCLGEPARIARVVPEGISFFGLVIPKPQLDAISSPIGQLVVPFIEASRDGHTIRLYDRDACLTDGDSGYPVFMPGPHQRYELAGLLISGIGGCPTMPFCIFSN